MKNSILIIFVALSTLTFGQTPTSTFTVSPEFICACDSVYVTYTGNASPTATFNWEFNTSGQISGSGMGPYYVQYCVNGVISISLSVNDNGNFSDTTTQTIYSVICDGIKNNEIENIQLFPNPAIDYIYIKFANKIITAEIFDLTGKVVLKEKLNNEYVIDISLLEKGFYVVHLTSNNESTNLTLIKQ